ncbi:hypothetical protein QWY77_11495 [Thalassotalea ponticola]|uniref:hypothetical protein n=1 Tax=Thalassotalea ponticola TaxID=1523392 RepID=UPI0025B34752|nr:hypothetical protein [Thalassotalea ponticola]MDN3653365.1 hypothetical protein [Thalassotalea ponticola]
MDNLNTQLINEYVQALGQDVFIQTVELYEQQAQAYLHQLGEVAKIADHVQWQLQCHAMKSAAGNMGLQQLHAMLSSLEHSQETALQLTQRVEQLTQLNQQSLQQLKQWLAQG